MSTEVTVYVHKSPRPEWQACAESPGSTTPGDSDTPQPASTHRCECSRASKTPLPKCPDGEPMTANYQRLMQMVSEFLRAIPRQAN